MCNGVYTCGQGTIKIRDSRNVEIICFEGTSCQSLILDVDNVYNFELHCVGSESCQTMQVTLNNMSSWSDIPEIHCYAEGACNYINIVTDNNSTKLKMYRRSIDVQLDNNLGYWSQYGNIQCYDHTRYFIKIFETDTQETIFNSIVAKFTDSGDSSFLPCNSINVKCNYTECSMSQTQLSVNLRLVNGTICNWVAIKDLMRIACDGDCPNSPTPQPTVFPTTNPTDQTNPPTFPPTISPSGSPTQPPSNAPTFPPTNSPTNAPK